MGQFRAKRKSRANLKVAIASNGQPGVEIGSGWLREVLDERVCTPILNTVLARVSRDASASHEARLHCMIIRKSWGNWCGYAIEDPSFRDSEVPDLPSDVVEQLAYGTVCPRCGNSATPQADGLPERFRWHRKCLAITFARDAARAGNDTEHKWAKETLGEYGMPVPPRWPEEPVATLH